MKHETRITAIFILHTYDCKHSDVAWSEQEITYETTSLTQQHGCGEPLSTGCQRPPTATTCAAVDKNTATGSEQQDQGYGRPDRTGTAHNNYPNRPNSSRT